jgi:hypothetical protein
MHNVSCFLVLSGLRAPRSLFVPSTLEMYKFLRLGNYKPFSDETNQDCAEPNAGWQAQDISRRWLVYLVFHRGGSVFNLIPYTGIMFAPVWCFTMIPRSRQRCGSIRALETRVGIEHRPRSSKSEKGKVDAGAERANRAVGSLDLGSGGSAREICRKDLTDSVLPLWSQKLWRRVDRLRSFRFPGMPMSM